MEIRPLTYNDFKQVNQLHEAMGAKYELDLGGTDFIIQNGAFDDDNSPVAVVLGRMTTEAYLLIDKMWRTPQERMDMLQNLAMLSASEAKSVYGIKDTHVWIPPDANKFIKRLRRMGFADAPWKCLTARL